MKTARLLAILLLATSALPACDDGDPVGPTIADLAGFWNATSLSFDDDTGNAPGFGIDAVTDVGGTITLDVARDGRFSGTLAVPGVTSHPETGETITHATGGVVSLVDDQTLSFDFDAATEAIPGEPLADFEAEFTLDGDVLTFSYETTFDFPDDFEVAILGVARGPVPAVVRARFQR